MTEEQKTRLRIISILRKGDALSVRVMANRLHASEDRIADVLLSMFENSEVTVEKGVRKWGGELPYKFRIHPDFAKPSEKNGTISRSMANLISAIEEKEASK